MVMIGGSFIAHIAERRILTYGVTISMQMATHQPMGLIDELPQSTLLNCINTQPAMAFLRHPPAAVHTLLESWASYMTSCRTSLLLDNMLAAAITSYRIRRRIWRSSGDDILLHCLLVLSEPLVGDP